MLKNRHFEKFTSWSFFTTGAVVNSRLEAHAVVEKTELQQNLIPWQSRDSMSTVAPLCSFALLSRMERPNTGEIESRDTAWGTWLSRYERFHCVLIFLRQEKVKKNERPFANRTRKSSRKSLSSIRTTPYRVHEVWWHNAQDMLSWWSIQISKTTLMANQPVHRHYNPCIPQGHNPCIPQGPTRVLALSCRHHTQPNSSVWNFWGEKTPKRTKKNKKPTEIKMPQEPTAADAPVKARLFSCLFFNLVYVFWSFFPHNLPTPPTAKPIFFTAPKNKLHTQPWTFKMTLVSRDRFHHTQNAS